MSKALIPIDVIANDVCSDLDDSTLKHKFKITRHLIACFRHFSTYLSNYEEVKTCVLVSDNSVNLPCDFVYETKVGILRNGCLATLTLDRNVRYGKAKHSDVEDYLNDKWGENYQGEGYWFYNAYRGDSYLGELYGRGRGVYNSGVYDIDRKNGVIFIGSMVPSDAEIVVEYASDGVSDGLKMVPVEIQKMMEYYAKSEFYADRNITQSQINRNRYESEYMTVKRLYNFRDALYMSAEVNKSFSPTLY